MRSTEASAPLWPAGAWKEAEKIVSRSPTDFEERVYAPQRITAIVATLAEDGVSPAHVLAGSGLDEAAPVTRVSYAQVATVLHNALRLAPDPAFALRAGARMHLTQYGIYGYALLSSRTYAQLLEFSVKYRRVIGPMTSMAYDAEHNPAICSFEPLLSLDPCDPLYRIALEFTYAAHLTLCRDVLGPTFNLTAVHVTYPAPAHANAYATLLQCPTVQFAQSANELHFDPAWAGCIPQLQDGITHEMARQSCQQFLDELTHISGTAALVRRALADQMPWRFPKIEAMALELALEPRTLRRKLEAQGTSYRQILADVRRGLAIEYLRKTRMTTEEIASRLGYSDAANFRHAFARWTGKTPHAYRLI
ncbi:AraC-like DNA-binding protein [Variovorax boronicumulans]|uniref:AraC-like DNA-binding protein n=1 Tax=Variovorax boronicumulans TaxID=436515 RepID=A0AAW8DV39_9BURK|nr:AraC family transcriptional regulator [Variovorax boronicumulans]MDP9923299.1 AraC-like DNA-binding protein [Variovorax boronicumulans]